MNEDDKGAPQTQPPALNTGNPAPPGAAVPAAAAPAAGVTPTAGVASATASLQPLAALMDAWLARHRKPPATLYHYTSAQGLHGMLTSTGMWATNVGFLNDPSEMRYAARLIRDILGEEADKLQVVQKAAGQNAGFWRSLALKYFDALAGNMTTWTESLLKTFEDQGDAYMTCFCTKGDLLSQWRGYGATGGGYAVGFDARQIGTGGALLRRVIYKRKDQQAIVRNWVGTFLSLGQSLARSAREEPVVVATPKAEGVFAQIAESFRGLGVEMKRAASAKQILDPAQQVFTNFLAECLICFKDPAYAEEQEWRLILFGRNVPEIKFRASGVRLIPYVELALETTVAGKPENRLPLKSITYGPTLEPAVTQKSLSMLLSRYSYAPTVEIKRSGIPFRN